MAEKPYKILGARWWTPKYTTIGIVAIETFNGTWKAYLGVASGFNERLDEQDIAAWGAGLQPQEAHGFFPDLDIGKYKPD